MVSISQFFKRGLSDSFKILLFCSLEEAIPLAVLLAFASEGNNAGDGIGLAKYTNEWIKMVRMNYERISLEKFRQINLYSRFTGVIVGLTGFFLVILKFRNFHNVNMINRFQIIQLQK